MSKGCIVCKYKKKPNDNVTFHKFPRDENLRQLWISAIKNDSLKITNFSIICSRHFSEDRLFYPPFGLQQRRHLKEGSVPTIFNIPTTLRCTNKEEFILSDNNTSQAAVNAFITPTTSKVCDSASGSERNAIEATPKFPKDTHRGELWISAIGKENLKVTNSSVVCSCHFCKDLLFYPPNGLEQNRLLKKDAIPTIFDITMESTETGQHISSINNDNNTSSPKNDIEYLDVLSSSNVHSETTDSSPVKFLKLEVKSERESSTLEDTCNYDLRTENESSILVNSKNFELAPCITETIYIKSEIYGSGLISGSEKEHSLASESPRRDLSLESSQGSLRLSECSRCDLISESNQISSEPLRCDLTSDSTKENCSQPNIEKHDLTSNTTREIPTLSLSDVHSSDLMESQSDCDIMKDLQNKRSEWMSETIRQVLTKEKEKKNPNSIKWKRKLNPRFFGDMDYNDFKNPNFVERNWKIVADTVTSQRRKINILQMRNIRLRKQVENYKTSTRWRKKVKKFNTTSLDTREDSSDREEENKCDDEASAVKSKIEDDDLQTVMETDESLTETYSNDNELSTTKTAECLESQSSECSQAVMEPDESWMENYSNDNEPSTAKTEESLESQISECDNNTTENKTPHNPDKILQTLYEYIETKKESKSRKDEFDTFGNYVALQLRKLPLNNALRMQQTIQTLLFDERLKLSVLSTSK